MPADSGIGGAAIVKACFGVGLSSRAISVDEGRVDDELSRAEEDELSWPPLEAELFVPPLPLDAIRALTEQIQTGAKLTGCWD